MTYFRGRLWSRAHKFIAKRTTFVLEICMCTLHAERVELCHYKINKGLQASSRPTFILHSYIEIWTAMLSREWRSAFTRTLHNTHELFVSHLFSVPCISAVSPLFSCCLQIMRFWRRFKISTKSVVCSAAYEELLVPSCCTNTVQLSCVGPFLWKIFPWTFELLTFYLLTLLKFLFLIILRRTNRAYNSA